ncbi:MAG: hypothetical protein ACYC5O_03280 [Anaerolineae bacterium]
MYQLRIELPDSLRQPLERVAADAGQTPEEWVRGVVRQHLGPRDQRLRCHFGAVDLGAPTGADNDSIDADLVRAYDDTGD